MPELDKPHQPTREEIEEVKVPLPGREAQAALDLEHTQISRGAAWMLTLLFLFTICLPALTQLFVELRARQPVRFLEVFEEVPAWEKIKAARTLEEARALLPDADRLKQHESSLEDESVWVKWLLPRAQNLLTQVGAGNEQAYVGKDGWLFYRPDVDYLTSPGFLDPFLLTMKKRSGDDESDLIQPDPIRAIIGFRDQLKTRGIEFIVVPMPVKAALESEKFAVHSGAGTPALQNPSYPDFVRQLQKAGVLVYDPATVLQRRKQQSGAAQFLQTDTHWTPEAMESIAADLAKFIRASTPVEQGNTVYQRRAQTLENLGDTAVMLSLADDQKLFPKQRVQIHQVLDASGAPWKAEPSAEVLLLGDSFCNIYSLAGMGWGEGAGFAEQLSFHLERPLDSIVVNAGGSHTSRQRLIGEMQRAKKQGQNRLSSTRVVIWQFSQRDLLIGDWKFFDLPGSLRSRFNTQDKRSFYENQKLRRGCKRSTSGRRLRAARRNRGGTGTFHYRGRDQRS